MSEPGARDDLDDLRDKAPCGLFSLSADGRVAYANQRIATLTGYASDALPGMRIHDLLSVPARIFYETNISPMLRLKGSIDEVAINFRTREGATVQTLVNAVEQRDADGTLRFTRFAVFNAVERRRYERALVDANAASEQVVAVERRASELREQFIAVLGHDLRNPLASIDGGIGLLRRRETLSENGAHVLALMQGSVRRASELIDDVLDFARGRLGGGIALTRDAAAPLTPVLEQVVAELMLASPDREIRAVFDIAEPIDCDRVRIGQLLSNLVGNAVTHGSADIPIRIAATGGDALVISVANGGSPIDAETMERLFQPFFRGELRPNQAGLGLGLHIASEIAKAHGGSLAAASDATETRFTFTMPLP